MDHSFTWHTLLLLLVFAAISFFFSVSETAIIALSRIRLRHMVDRGIKRAKIIQRLIGKIDNFIVGILVGNNLVNIAMSAIITGICVYVFGYEWGIFIATLISVFFIVILCEITPKILAIKKTEQIALFVAPLMEAFLNVFRPVIFVFDGASKLIFKALRIPPAKKSPLVTEEELRLMVEMGREEGFLTDDEGRMLQRIFEFGDIKVKDVMVPREKVVAVDIKSTPEELLNIFVEEGHARLPVYKSSPNNIVGVIYARDLLYILRDKGLFLLEDLVHEAYYILADTPVNELLRRFQAQKIQIAIVADANKKAVGLVTLEDLIEEIVGEIEEVRSRNDINKN